MLFNMYKFHLISLINCPYSEAANEIVKNMNHKVINVQPDSIEKEKYQKDYPTFPQIYFTNDKNKIFLGGYTELKKIMDTINEKTDNLDILLKNLEFTRMKRKDKLRLLNLVLG